MAQQMSINFAEVEGSFAPLPEGEYECTVERVEVRESKSSDHNYLSWELEVTEEGNEGRRLWMITSLSPKALFRLKDVLVALGVTDGDEELLLEWEDDVDITPGEGPLVISPALDGLACTAIVTNEVWEGKERNRVNELAGATKPKARSSKPAPKRKSGTGARRKLR